MAENLEDLSEEVVKWLHETGFPLEMRVRSQLAKLQKKMTFGFANSAYTDKSTGKAREGGDAVIHTSRVEQRQKDGVWFQYRTYVFAVIECKNPKKPWVAFLKPLSPGYQMIHGMACDVSDSDTLRWNLSRSEYRNPLQQQIGMQSLLLAPANVAYSIVEFKSDQNNNKPYNAVQQVIEASQGVAAEHSEYFSDPKHKNLTLFGAFSFVVTSGSIYASSLSEHGTPKVERVETAVYLDERGISGRTRFVRLMTEKFFDANF